MTRWESLRAAWMTRWESLRYMFKSLWDKSNKQELFKNIRNGANGALEDAFNLKALK